MHILTVFAIIVSLVLKSVDNASTFRWRKSPKCPTVPSTVLETVLGAAFNPRYMSVSQPLEDDSAKSGKRGSSAAEDFYVDDNFAEEVNPEPAWSVANHVALVKGKGGLLRSRRSVDNNESLQEWHCKSKLAWIDLGPDYFPRYLKSVTCSSEKCWYGFFKCKPRSFAVKLLKRKKGFCASKSFNEVGSKDLPEELEQMWVWEERAVNFCCDCSLA